MKQIIRDYFELARNEHLLFDVIFPFVSGVLFGILINQSNISLLEFSKGFTNFLTVLIAAFSILAGFSLTTLSIFATSNSPIVEHLKTELITGTRRPKIDQIFAYFSWSIAFQLSLLFVLVLFSLFYSYFPIKNYLDSSFFAVTTWFITILGIIGALHSVILTIRNITILHTFLVASARQK